MIVWLPDFRFVWSPRNHDVRRRGGEVAMWLRDLRSRLDVRGHLARNRTTYDRPGLEDVQVVYRPVWSGGGTATWAGGPWKAALTNTFTGARYPVPNRVNELPGFWTTDVSLGRRWRVGGAALDVGIDIT